VISYHPSSDAYVDPDGSFDTRLQYYRPGSGIPLVIMDGTTQFLGGMSSGTRYDSYLPAFNTAAAQPSKADISIVLESATSVRVEVTNTTATALQGTLHIAVVERYRPENWRDMSMLDFIERAMIPGPNGQTATISPSQKFTSTQQFSISSGWNYCSIVAFFQLQDKSIAQGAMIEIPDSIPALSIQGGPGAGQQWFKGSTHNLSWSSNRTLQSVVFEYSIDSGQNWISFQPTSQSGNNFTWTVPNVNSSRCLLSVRDPFGGARAVSNLFSIGTTTGDINRDGKIDDTDRNLLTDYLLENETFEFEGSDLNGDGKVDFFDVIYFDENNSQ
jgi:hypothetical protein